VLQALLAGLVAPTASAETYHVAPSGSDANPGTEAQPWASFEHAWTVLERGDTLVLLDGVYRQTLSPNLPPLDPADPQYVTIRAKNDGKAVLDGEGVRVPVQLLGHRSAAYVILEGLVARNGATYVWDIRNHHVIVRRSSGYDAGLDDNSSVFVVVSHDVLLEDCVAAGTGRKMFLIYNGARNTIRRCFGYWQRHDSREFCGWWPYGAAFEIYDSPDNIIENSVGYARAASWQFYVKTDNALTVLSVNNKVLGNMAVLSARGPDGAVLAWPPPRPRPTTCNQPGSLTNFDWGDVRTGFDIYAGGPLRDSLFQDNLAYGSAARGLAVNGRCGRPCPGEFTGNVLRRFTAFANGIDNPDSDVGIYGGRDTDATQADLDLFAATGGLRIDRVFQSWPDYPTGTRVFTSLTGEGARLRHRYVDGVLMDGSGGRPAEPLWPWPMEERIQTELGVSVTNLMADIVPDQVPRTSCAFTLSPARVSVPGSGGTTTIGVEGGTACPWGSNSDASWVTVSPSTGTGRGSTVLTVAANTDPVVRTAHVTLAGSLVTVTQGAGVPTCTYSVSPTSLVAPAAGGTTDVAVTAGAGCGWTASSGAAWATVSPASGTGSASVAVSVSRNAGTTRNTDVTVAGQTISVTQEGATSSSLRITDVRSFPAAEVPLHEKLEVAFDVLGSGATRKQWPYDPLTPHGIPPGEGISVDAVFTDPAGREFRQPAFYAERFVDEVRDGRDWHLPTGEYVWRVRLSPHLPGAWTYRLTARDRTGYVESPTYAFAVTPSPRRGFVKVSARDPRYFEHDDGTLFAGRGFNFLPHLDDPATKGGPEYARLKDHGVNLVRVWISGIFGSAWNTWTGGRGQQRGYLSVTGLMPFHDEATGETTLTMRLDYEPEGDVGWFDACRMQFWDDPESILPGRTYRIRIEYRGIGITGPRSPAAPDYGLVAKLGGWHANCYEPGTGSPVTTYGRSTDGWGYIEGTWRSGSLNYLPRMHLGLENVRQGTVYVRSISLREDPGDGTLGPELMVRSSMEHHLYIPEEHAYALDKVVGLAERNGVYLKLVVMEKNDKIYLKMADDGTWASPDNEDGFYGVGRTVNKTRWLQQMWWRYLQARWGYSPAIHSWELTNEGSPFLTRHFELADEFGKYMHCRVFGVEPGAGAGVRCPLDHPNDHLVTTSFWQWFPIDFWGSSAYPNVDYADVHAYVSTSWAPLAERQLMQWDAAYFHTWHARDLAAARVGKPIVRGESGLDAPGGGTPDDLGLTRDTAGVWLHNFLWAGLHSGAMTDLYWHTSHIWDTAVDRRSHYRPFGAFLADVALNQGGYADWAGSVSHPDLRVVGQKNTTTGRLILWVQNRRHTWKNVVDGIAIPPVSGEVVVPGFAPGARYVLERWNTTSGSKISDEALPSDAAGSLRIVVTALDTDVAFKVRPSPRAPTRVRIVP
jgi:hypothetical protein